MGRAPGISHSISGEVGAAVRQASDATFGWRAGRWAALAVAVLLIIGASALSYRSQQDLLSAGEAVDHTRGILIKIERLLSLLKDTGAGMRSYLLTGDKEILEPSDTAVTALPKAMADLRALTADNPAQQRRLDDLQPLVDERVARVARLLEAGRTQGVAVLTDEETRHARETMDHIRAIVAAMTEEESERDRSRTEAARAEARAAGYPLLAGTLLSLALIVFVFYRMNSEMGRRRTAEISLRDLNETLEERVHERTQQLNASERRYRKVVDLIQEAIWIHQDGIIQFVNPAALKLFGAATADALIGRSIFSLLHPDDRARALERTKTVTAEKRAVPVVEARLVGLDGRTRIAELHAVPFMQDDRLHVLSAGRDVTAQRDAEAQLRQSQKIEAVGRLTGGVAHDFNNLLTVIVGNADVLAELCAGDDRRGELARGILSAATRGSELTKQLLAFSRQQPLEPRRIDVTALVRGMDNLLRRTLGEDVDLRAIEDHQLWSAVADPAQLESALLNLAINARDAMPAGGRLMIETRNIHLDEDYAARNAEVKVGDYVMVAVTDTGSGMPPEVLERAFEPFFTTKETGKGTGLGLSMIYGFMKQSGGHVKIYSEVGLGTTMRLYLPRAAADAPAPVAPAVQTDVPIGNETILAVEDDVDVRLFVVAQLESLGYRVLAAETGIRARAILSGPERIDLLFTDVVMPGGLTGKQLADEAVRQRPQLKTLYTSGYTENTIIHQGRLDPGVQLLSKPYRRGDLARKVRQVLDGGQS